jgi:RimJ/RimL family protein N-acetyltransferase
MGRYLCLTNQEYKKGDFRLIPLREEDKYSIMNWRNAQIYHLRQDKLLTKTDQDAYFKNVVSNIYNQPKPSQILFSYLNKEECIGYGGLVHINWKDKNAEISFIINTELEAEYFQFHWSLYLTFIEAVAFIELKLHKIFVYAFDLRPHLYSVLEISGYIQEARLREHVIIDDKFKDVVIYSKIKLIEK